MLSQVISTSIININIYYVYIMNLVIDVPQNRYRDLCVIVEPTENYPKRF